MIDEYLICHFALGRKQLKRGGVYNWWAWALFVYRVRFPITKEPTTITYSIRQFCISSVSSPHGSYHFQHKKVTSKVYSQANTWRHKRKRYLDDDENFWGHKRCKTLDSNERLKETHRSTSKHLSHRHVNAIAFSGLTLLPSLAFHFFKLIAGNKCCKTFNSYGIVKCLNIVPIASSIF
jgi:hypothetical protein